MAAEDMLQASVAAGQSGPVITLSGETDLTSVARLSALISGQPLAGTVELTIDISDCGSPIVRRYGRWCWPPGR